MAEAGVLIRAVGCRSGRRTCRGRWGAEIDHPSQRVAISGCARHIERMNSDVENPIKRKLHDVAERAQALAAVRAEAERRGIDWRGKTWRGIDWRGKTLGEIRKLLAADEDDEDK